MSMTISASTSTPPPPVLRNPILRNEGLRKQPKRAQNSQTNKQKFTILQNFLRNPRPWAPPGDFLVQGWGVYSTTVVLL